MNEEKSQTVAEDAANQSPGKEMKMSHQPPESKASIAKVSTEPIDEGEKLRFTLAGILSGLPAEFIFSYNTIVADTLALGDKTSGESVAKLSSPKVQQALTTLFSDASTIWSYASEYDYSPKVPYNGFRSFLQIVFAYFDHLSVLVRLLKIDETSTREKRKLIKRINDFVDFIPLLNLQLDSLKLIRKQRSQNDTPALGAEKQESSIPNDASLSYELAILENQMTISSKEMSIYFKKSLHGFWLPQSIRKVTRRVKAALIYLTYPPSQGIPAAFSEKKFRELVADNAINWSYTDINRVSYRLAKKRCPPGMTVGKFNLEKRQYSWTINGDQMSRHEHLIWQSKTPPSQDPVRLVICKPESRVSNHVILHIHGGGWIAGSVEHYYPLLGEWAREIGAAIVSVDYSLSPVHKFPVALQEILDTYLWLSNASTNRTTVDALGFIPEDIVVTGDSAGGNLTIALTILLAEITKKASHPPKLPRAVVPMYPIASPGMPFITASSTLFDVFMYPLQRSKLGIYYLSGDPSEPGISFLNGKNNPWFADAQKYQDIYTVINGSKQSDPLFHLVTYQWYHLLKQVPLYLQAAEFDPLLDDAVQLAKLWKGEVTFDVMPKAIHGYLMFVSLSPECKQASEKSLARLKEAIEK